MRGRGGGLGLLRTMEDKLQLKTQCANIKMILAQELLAFLRSIRVSATELLAN